MSTTTHVPEGRDLDGDDAMDVLSEAVSDNLAGRALVRFRHADGSSFARSLAFQMLLAFIPGTIFFVGLAAALGQGRLQSLLRTMIESLTPGPAGQMLLSAFGQGAQSGNQGNVVAVAVGGGAMLVSAVAGMVQLQRGTSRIYGVERDRSLIAAYGRAMVMTLTVGVLLAVAFVLIALGGSMSGFFDEGFAGVWFWVRWPVGLVALAFALTGLFKFAPNRRQPSMSWLAVGSTVAIVAWVAVSAGLALYLDASTTFGETYGPLAGIIGFAVWAQLSAMAILYGVAVAAEVEAYNAGIDEQ